MKEFFLNLKSKRQERGISLEDIHQKTRLPIAYLKALESGSLEMLPKGYERLYLKRYAQELGMDVDEILRDFDLLTGRLIPNSETAQQDAGQPAHSEAEDDKIYSPAERLKELLELGKRYTEELNLDKINHFFWIGLAGLIVVITGYFTLQQYFSETGYQKVEIKEKTLPELIENFQNKDSLFTPTLSEETFLRSDIKPTITIKINALKRTQVKEIRDQQDSIQYIILPGIKRHIEATEQVKFSMDRADGLEIWLNDVKLAPIGNPDEIVLSLILTQKGIREKNVKRMPPKKPLPTSAAGNTSPDSSRVP